MLSEMPNTLVERKIIARYRVVTPSAFSGAQIHERKYAVVSAQNRRVSRFQLSMLVTSGD